MITSSSVLSDNSTDIHVSDAEESRIPTPDVDVDDVRCSPVSDQRVDVLAVMDTTEGYGIGSRIRRRLTAPAGSSRS
jgi:hypothetical protein